MNEPTLEQRLLVMKMIWVAFILTLFVFGGVLQVAKLMAPDPGQSAPYEIYAIVVLILASTAALLPKKLYQNNKKTLPEQGFLDHAYVPWLLGMVLMEQVAIVGFIFCFQTGNPNLYLPFFVASIIGQAIAYPSENRLRSMFQ